MTARFRECPTPGCDGTHARHDLVCPTCWRAAPRAMQRTVYATVALSEPGIEARVALIAEVAKLRFGVLIEGDERDDLWP